MSVFTAWLGRVRIGRRRVAAVAAGLAVLAVGAGGLAQIGSGGPAPTRVVPVDQVITGGSGEAGDGGGPLSWPPLDPDDGSLDPQDDPANPAWPDQHPESWPDVWDPGQVNGPSTPFPPVGPIPLPGLN